MDKLLAETPSVVIPSGGCETLKPESSSVSQGAGAGTGSSPLPIQSPLNPVSTPLQASESIPNLKSTQHKDAVNIQSEPFPKSLESKRPENIIIPKGIPTLVTNSTATVPSNCATMTQRELQREELAASTSSQNQVPNAHTLKPLGVGQSSTVYQAAEAQQAAAANYLVRSQNQWVLPQVQQPQNENPGGQTTSNLSVSGAANVASVPAPQNMPWQYVMNPHIMMSMPNTGPKNVSLTGSDVSANTATSPDSGPPTDKMSETPLSSDEKRLDHQRAKYPEPSSQMNSGAQYHLHYPNLVHNAYPNLGGIPLMVPFPGPMNTLIPSPDTATHSHLSSHTGAPGGLPLHAMINPVSGLPNYGYPTSAIPQSSAHPGMPAFSPYSTYSPSAGLTPNSSYPPNSGFPQNCSFTPNTGYPPNTAFPPSIAFTPLVGFPPNSGVSSNSNFGSAGIGNMTPNSGVASHSSHIPHMGQLEKLGKPSEFAPPQLYTSGEDIKSDLTFASTSESSTQNSHGSSYEKSDRLPNGSLSNTATATAATVSDHNESQQPQHERNNQAMLELMLKISQIKSSPQGHEQNTHSCNDNSEAGKVATVNEHKTGTFTKNFHGCDEQGKVLPPPTLPLQCNPKRVARQQKKRSRPKSDSKGPKIPRRDRYWLDQQANLVSKLEERGFSAIQRETSTELKFVCSLCYKGFDTKLLCIRHAVEHLDFKPFKCNDCDMEFTRCDTLQRHLKGRCLGPQARLMFDGKGGKFSTDYSEKPSENALNSSFDKNTGFGVIRRFGENYEALKRGPNGGGGANRKLSGAPNPHEGLNDRHSCADAEASGINDSSSESDTDSEAEQGAILNGAKFGLFSRVPPVVKPGEIPVPVKPASEGTSETTTAKAMVEKSKSFESRPSGSGVNDIKNNNTLVTTTPIANQNNAVDTTGPRIPHPGIPLPVMPIKTELNSD